MSGLLQDRVCAWVADHPSRTAAEIARAVRGRDKTVLEILRDTGLFACEPRNAYASDKAVVYRLAVPWRGRRREGHPRTHKQRVLDLLRDGKPHSHLELYQLHVVAHSRISDLRQDGFEIAQWREGDLYMYRLLDGASSACLGTDGDASSSGRPYSATHPAAPASTVEPSPRETSTPMQGLRPAFGAAAGDVGLAEPAAVTADGGSTVEQLELLPQVRERREYAA